MQTPERLSDPVYQDAEAARAYIEQVRWPDFVVCPHCASSDKISQLGGEPMGRGWWYRGSCQDKFTVRVGSIFERSHIPLHKWLLAFRLMASSKKGVGAHQTASHSRDHLQKRVIPRASHSRSNEGHRSDAARPRR